MSGSPSGRESHQPVRDKRLVPYDDRPSGITGSWSDVERHAEYIYLTADHDSSEWMLAEAVLWLVTPR